MLGLGTELVGMVDGPNHLEATRTTTTPGQSGSKANDVTRPFGDINDAGRLHSHAFQIWTIRWKLQVIDGHHLDDVHTGRTFTSTTQDWRSTESGTIILAWHIQPQWHCQQGVCLWTITLWGLGPGE